MIDFDHTGYTTCTGCHAAPIGHWPGECASCHITENWYQVNFDHTGYTNCKSCHMRPAGHNTGQCSKCHTTDSWDLPSSTPTPTETPESAATEMPPSTPAEPETGTPLVEPTTTPIPLPTIDPVEKDYDPFLVPSPPPTVEH